MVCDLLVYVHCNFLLILTLVVSEERLDKQSRRKRVYFVTLSVVNKYFRMCLLDENYCKKFQCKIQIKGKPRVHRA